MTHADSGLGIDSALDEVSSWLSDFISKSHPDIGRIGPICPFVAPARKNKTLEMRVRFVGSSPGLALIEEIARSSLAEFRLLTWQGRNRMLRAMVVVMPDLRGEDTGLLDEAQARMKDAFVENGLMVGQFHENCEVTAARNPEFAVSRAPVPVLAIREIALHDIFFLSDRRHWFDKYREKFGQYYDPKFTEIDQVLVDRYRQAEEVYGFVSTSR